MTVFRDPDYAEHSCHVGASQLREWSPVPEGTLREVARVREFIRHGPCELTNKLEEAGLHRLAEALQAAGWHVGIPVVHAEEMLRRAKRLAPALPDVVEGEYWEAPSKVVTCRMWRVREVMRFTSPDACAIVRMEDPRPDSPAGQRLLTASTMEHDGWRRCVPAEPQVGERFWRVVGHCLDGRVVMEVTENLTTGRVTRANVPAPVANGWRRATPDEEQAARAADSRAVAK